ncbi:hypothetical protein B0T11DRAFT_77434 [Plectosphaerella cucumerina]|uniref:Uncharacterized protein n=1 Tax=Plectosphaerella cucumerina TaxID=40658 RepID=A0A8K0X2K5_9PEZI|nr:hypothetical protein B0T11DRAFT_77434 [Plectosphaerella cucumerina]
MRRTRLLVRWLGGERCHPAGFAHTTLRTWTHIAQLCALATGTYLPPSRLPARQHPVGSAAGGGKGTRGSWDQKPKKGRGGGCGCPSTRTRASRIMSEGSSWRGGGQELLCSAPVLLAKFSTVSPGKQENPPGSMAPASQRSSRRLDRPRPTGQASRLALAPQKVNPDQEKGGPAKRPILSGPLIFLLESPSSTRSDLAQRRKVRAARRHGLWCSMQGWTTSSCAWLDFCSFPV